jgi:hypothetical protein
MASDWDVAEHLAVWISQSEGFSPTSRYEIINKSGIKGVVYKGKLKYTKQEMQLELLENTIQDSVSGDMLHFDVPEDGRFYEDWREKDGQSTVSLK